MDWTSIVVAVITGGLAFLGVCITNRKNTSLILYRVDQLEKKQEKYNNLQERTYHLEERSKLHDETFNGVNLRIAELERRVDT